MAVTPKYLARIAYNSERWWRPTKAGEVKEAGKSYRSEHGFGHEDWLFRNEWLIDGWRYGFVQGVNRSRKKLLKQNTAFDLRLFTMPAAGGRRYVAELFEVECLSDQLAADAVAEFSKAGWLDVMREEIATAGGSPEALDQTEYAPFILNLRFRLDNLRLIDSVSPMAQDDFAQRIKRYSLCTLDRHDVDDATWRGRAGNANPPAASEHVRNLPGGRVRVSPEHARMQRNLQERLRIQYPDSDVLCEQDFVDVMVRARDETILFEIKSDLNPLSVVRQAIGQVLEYAFHPCRAHQPPVRLIIVGRRPLMEDDLAYFERIKREFSLPIDYWVVEA